jgi:ankyrin repeat protein
VLNAIFDHVILPTVVKLARDQCFVFIRERERDMTRRKLKSMQSISDVVTLGSYSDFVNSLEQWVKQQLDAKKSLSDDVVNQLLFNVASSRVDAVKKVKRLLDMGADVNARRTSRRERHLSSSQRPTQQGQHVLAVAVHGKAWGVVQLLLDSGADVNATFMSRGGSSMVSAIRTSFAITKLLVEYGVDLNTINSNGDSPLMAAAAAGKVRTVSLLIYNGVDVNTQSRKGVNALHRATISRMSGSVKVVSLLLEAGANPHVRCNYPGNRAVPNGCGYTALQHIRGRRATEPDSVEKIALLNDAMLERIFEKRAAFAMALQERLGANSTARMLSSCLMQTIMGLTLATHSDPQFPSLEALPSSTWILLGHEDWSDKFSH